MKTPAKSRCFHFFIGKVMSLSTTFILGPAYSGKSEHVINTLNPDKPTKFYVTGSTSQEMLTVRYDELINQREIVSKGKWQTHLSEDLTAELKSHNPNEVMVIDCTYSWLSRIIIEHSKTRTLSPDQILQVVEHETKLFLSLLESMPAGEAYIISTEIGACSPSSNPFERLFREVNGRLNQKLAALSQRVIKIDAGITTVIKEKL